MIEVDPVKRTYRLVQERVTALSVAYNDLDGSLPRLYIPKAELGPRPPTRLNLTIEEVTE